MKIKKVYTIPSEWKTGDVMWFCHVTSIFETTTQTFQPPIQGILTAYNSEIRHKHNLNKNTEPRYFVPFKENTTEPEWSKCVSVYSHGIADTKKECTEIYHDMLKEQIEYHNDAIRKLNMQLRNT